ncbi:MAG: heme exporter protein CcmD [Alphaproteobacteria bacterium]|nr:heme exporter protein CcmD [Alphaproteobacteria bacterium]MDE2042990.1 heme exporter protein CcmD [Alphaproteobacteria bacterium]MDE2340045.1 heme exporter protein CcmD [Alphaproteobacteria bacterium]
MNPWPFVFAAYGITGAATLALLTWSYAAMRRAEADVAREDAA